MKSKAIPAVLAIVMLIAGYWIGHTTSVPENEIAGTIGAATRVQTPQMSVADVQIEEPELQQILQSDEFQQMVDDGVFAELFANPELAELWAHPDFTMALAHPEVVLALSNPKLMEAMATNREYLEMLARPRISAVFGTWLLDREVRQTIADVLRVRDGGDQTTLTLALSAHPELRDALAQAKVQALLARNDFRVLLANPRFRDALANPQFCEALASARVRQALASPRFTEMLSSPRLRQNLSYVALSTYIAQPSVRIAYVRDAGNP
jgi:hypothetical protein